MLRSSARQLLRRQQRCVQSNYCCASTAASMILRGRRASSSSCSAAVLPFSTTAAASSFLAPRRHHHHHLLSHAPRPHPNSTTTTLSLVELDNNNNNNRFCCFSTMTKRQHNNELKEDSYRYQVRDEMPVQRQIAQRLLSLNLKQEDKEEDERYSIEDWLEAEHCLPWWSVQRTVESVEVTFQLLDRLLHEQQQLHQHRQQQQQQHATTSTSTSTTQQDQDPNEQQQPQQQEEEELSVPVDAWLQNVDLGNRILNNWRVLWWNTTLPSSSPNTASSSDTRDAADEQQQQQILQQQYTPGQVLTRFIDTYHKQYGFPINEKSIYLIMEAAVSNSTDAVETADFCQHCLSTALTLYEQGNADCLPSTDFCNLVLRAWVRSSSGQQQQRHDNNTVSPPEQCEALVRTMTEHQIPLNRRTYVRVIHAWALTESKQGARKAQAWLQQMVAEYRAGDVRVRPDAATFTTVISAWAKSGARDAGTRGQDILQQMYDMHANHQLKVHNLLSVAAINATMQCYANQKTLTATKHAAQLFQRMVHSANQKPNYISYLIMIKAWADVGRPKEAETLLEHMYKTYRSIKNVDTHTRLKPDVAIWTTVLKAWAKSRDRNKTERVRNLIKDMHQLSQAHGDLDLRPTRATYNTLLDCMANDRGTQFPAAAAQDVLNEMKARAAAGDTDLAPDLISYSSVIHCWAAAGHAKQARQNLIDMFADYRNNGNKNAKPDLQCFNTVLSAFIKSKDRHSASQAYSFFREMKSVGLSSNSNDNNNMMIDLKPDVYSYTSVISCLARTRGKMDKRRRHAALAEELFREMQEEYRSTGDKRLRPNTAAYNALINAWANAYRPDRAEEILQEMYLDFVEGGNDAAKPEAHSFNTLLKAWAMSTQHRDVSCKKAEEVLARMKELTESGALDSVTPDMVSYSTLMLCYGLTKQPLRAEEVLATMKSLYEEGLLDEAPSRRTFRNLRKAWLYSNEPNKEERMAEIKREIQEKFGAGTDIEG